jgi:predicted nucleic acid-binding protein
LSVRPRARVYFDTNVFIYALEREPAFAEAAVAILEDSGGRPFTSEYTIAECLVGNRRSGGDPQLQEDYLAYFADPESIVTIPVSRGLLVSAARLASELGLKLADAIHVASALSVGCQSFVTNDRKLGLRLPDSLECVPLSSTPPAGS